MTTITTNPAYRKTKSILLYRMCRKMIYVTILFCLYSFYANAQFEVSAGGTYYVNPLLSQQWPRPPKVEVRQYHLNGGFNYSIFRFQCTTSYYEIRNHKLSSAYHNAMWSKVGTNGKAERHDATFDMDYVGLKLHGHFRVQKPVLKSERARWEGSLGAFLRVDYLLRSRQYSYIKRETEWNNGSSETIVSSPTTTAFNIRTSILNPGISVDSRIIFNHVFIGIYASVGWQFQRYDAIYYDFNWEHDIRFFETGVYAGFQFEKRSKK